MATHTSSRLLRCLNYTWTISCRFAPLCANNNQGLQSCIARSSPISGARTYTDIVGNKDPVKAKKKKVVTPRITLLLEKNEISVVTLEEARNIAKRRKFKLVKIVDFDIKSERPVYKIMHIHDFIEAESKRKAEAKEAKNKTIKGGKTIYMSSKIAEHDLNTKVKSIHKILGKRHGVRISITNDGNKEKASEIRTFITLKCQDIAKVITKSNTSTNTRVTLRPILEKINQGVDDHDNLSEKT